MSRAVPWLATGLLPPSLRSDVQPQPEELPSQEPSREGPESGHIPERSGLNPVPHAPG